MIRITAASMILGLLLLILSGCGSEERGDAKTAEQYLKQLGYQVTSRQGEVDQYVLEKSKLAGGTENIPYLQSWSVQTVQPDMYFGKEITVYSFTVKNHPLEKEYNIETNVNVMLCEGQVIGGTSFPVQGKVLLMGALYSLEGKTFEEVTEMSYQEWSEKWKIQ